MRSLLTVVGGRCGEITVVCPDVIIIVSLIVISTSHEAHTNWWCGARRGKDAFIEFCMVFLYDI